MGIYRQKIGYSAALLSFLAALFGCDAKTGINQTRPSTGQSPTTGAEVPPPRGIPAASLPSNENELNVDAAFPGPDEPRVALVSPVSVSFDSDLLQGQNLAQMIRVIDRNGTSVPGAVSQPSADTLLFRATNHWTPSSRYRVEIDPALMSSAGLSVNAELRWSFTTIADVHTTSQRVIDLCMSDADVEMLAAVNRVRTTARSCRGTPYPATTKLTWNCSLQESAVAHSQDMASNNFFEHTGSDGSNPTQRILRTGYVASATGENLAAGYRTIDDALDGLLRSTTGHCEILMAAQFTEFGSGYAFNANAFYQRYWTQNFARPGR